MKTINLYLNTLFTLFVMITCVSLAPGQTKLHAGWSEKGAVIYLSGTIPQSDNLQVFRHHTVGDSLEVGQLKIAKNGRQFRENEREMPAQFHGLLRFSDQAVETILKGLNTANKFEDVQGGWLTAVLFASGFAFADTSANSSEVSYYTLHSKSGFVAGSNKLPDPAREQIPMQAYGATSQSINPKLIWRTRLSARENMLGFAVYRSAPFDINFVPIDALTAITVSGDSLFLIARDTSLTQPGAYQYMVRTIDHFGRLSNPSEFQLAAYSPFAGYPMFSFADATGSTQRPEIEISWRLEGPSLAKSIDLFQARHFDGPYTRIAVLNPADTSYTDHIGTLKEQYYYYLNAIPVLPVDTNRSPIVTHLSTFEAKAYPPVEISAVTDSNLVKLSWLPFEGSELGFYIWRSKGFGMPMERISGLVRNPLSPDQPAWSDTSQSLRGDQTYGYAITAVAQGFAESNYSDTVMVRPLRKVALNVPEQTRIIRRNETSWFFLWADMQPELPSLYGYEVELTSPKEPADDKFSIREISRSQNFLELTYAQPGTTLRVRALDVFGNRSLWSNSSTIPESVKNNFGPQYIQGMATESGIVLNWFVLDTNVEAYKIFRIDADGKQTVFEIRDPLVDSFIDKSAAKGATYGYWVVSVAKGNTLSHPTEIVYLKKEF